MTFVEVLFPLKLSPLTYKCDETLSRSIKPGIIVSAPLKNRLTKGIVIGKSLNIPPGRIKEIKEINDKVPLLSTNMIKLLKWMSKYYMAEEGLVLKNMLPREALKSVKKRDTKKVKITTQDFDLCDIDNICIQKIFDSIRKKRYQTFLLHAPSSVYEYSFLIRLLIEINNVIILLPELSIVDNLYQTLNKIFGERVCLYHSDLSSGRRYEAIKRILEGYSDIIIGTRSAIFAPLKEVSLIVVLQEHNDSYKQEKFPCYHARDVAVMRGFFEKVPVLLSSICPSINSFFNCNSGKYSLLIPSNNNDIKPKMKIIDMRYEKQIKPSLSKTVIDNLERCIKNKKKVLLIINRRGYSTLLQCLDCNYIEECPNCKIPIIFHKHDMVLRCHYCNYISRNINDRCSRCKSFNLKMLGAGTQKIQEAIEEVFGVKTLRFDSDKIRKKADLDELTAEIFNADKGIIVGTKIISKKMFGWHRITMAAVLNADLPLSMPDFKSSERTFQEIMSLKESIEAGGTIFIQTRMPDHYVYKYLKSYDYYSFVREELMRRKSLRYPPYSKMIVIKIVGEARLSEEILKIVSMADKNVEILGPSSSRYDRDKFEYKVLLKSQFREKLHIAAKKIIETFKDRKDIKIKVDVDPVRI